MQNLGAGMEQLIGERLVFFKLIGLKGDGDLPDGKLTDGAPLQRTLQAVMVDFLSQGGNQNLLIARAPGSGRKSQGAVAARELFSLFRLPIIWKKFKNFLIFTAGIIVAFVCNQKDRIALPKLPKDLARQPVSGGIDHIEHVICLRRGGASSAADTDSGLPGFAGAAGGLQGRQGLLPLGQQ